MPQFRQNELEEMQHSLEPSPGPGQYTGLYSNSSFSKKPIVTKSRKSVASFKIRDGWPVGCKVTLRRERMYEFLDRLINVSIPRIRDFRGLSPKSFDGRGNYSMGVQEQIVFPEIDFDKVDAMRGMDITITTTAKDNEQGQALLKAFNFPFKAK